MCRQLWETIIKPSCWFVSPEYKNPVRVLWVPQYRVHVAMATAQDGDKRKISGVINIRHKSGCVRKVMATSRDNLHSDMIVGGSIDAE